MGPGSMGMGYGVMGVGILGIWGIFGDLVDKGFGDVEFWVTVCFGRDSMPFIYLFIVNLFVYCVFTCLCVYFFVYLFVKIDSK